MSDGEIAKSLALLEGIPTPNNTKDDDMIVSVYQECHSIRRECEARETRLTLGASALILGLTSYLLKNAAPLNTPATISSIVMIVLLCIITFWFLFDNGKKLTYCLRIIVRIEKAMGLYKDNIYQHLAGEHESLFPKDAKLWGENFTNRVEVWHHMSLVILVGVACIASLIMSEIFVTKIAQEKPAISAQ